MNSPRILLIDIETSPMVVYAWQGNLYNTNIRNEQVIEDMRILSFAAKWLGEDKVYYYDLRNYKSNHKDRVLLVSLHTFLDQADIVITQNGNAFDLPTIKTRMMFHNLPPPSPFITIDTYREAKRQFKFTYNSLDYLAAAMGCKARKDKHKNFPGLELWKEVLAGNVKAWKEMEYYNKQDVLVLEEVYLRMRPWIEGHPNVAIYSDKEKPVCPKCGGQVERRGTRRSNYGAYQQFHCLKCGGYSRGRTMVTIKEVRKVQLAN